MEMDEHTRHTHRHLHMHIHRYTKVFNLVGVYSSYTNTRDHTADKVWLYNVVYMHPLLRLSTMNGKNILCACVSECAYACMCLCVCACACAC